MTACPACAEAAVRPSHLFIASCRGCCARAAGRSPQFAAARKAGDRFDHQYVRLLEQFGLTHREVHAANAADLEAIRAAGEHETAHSQQLLARHRARSAAEFQREADGG